MKIDWKRKLMSRKFWIALAAFVSGIIIALGGSDSAAGEISGIIMSGASAVAYIVGEGLTDAANSTTRSE